jgi:hypothetical protein
MPAESAQTLLVGEEAAVVVRSRRTAGGFACSVHALLSGAVTREIALSGNRLEPIVRLADPRTLVVAVHDAGATRVDAYDLPAATPRWSRSLPEPQGNVLHLLPSGDVLLALDAAGGVRELALSDGKVVHETKIVGGIDVVIGTQPLVDEKRIVLLQRDEGGSASLEAFERSTGRASWRVAIPPRTNGGLLLRSGDLLVAIIGTRHTVTRLNASTPAPGPLQAWFVNALDGSTVGELSSAALGSWVPSAVLSDGALVVAGVEAVAVYR